LGGALFGYGIRLHTQQNIDILIPNDHTAIFSMALGALTFFIAFLGCCGAVKEDSCMLRSYAIVVMLLLILQISFVVFWRTNEKGFQDIIKDKLEQAVAKNDTASRAFMDEIQAGQFCCGFYGPKDYSDKIPTTCCASEKLTPEKACNQAAAFQTGCYQALVNVYTDNFQIIKWVGISVLAFQAGAVFISFCLASNIRRAYDVV
jgi:CD63 antigen